MQGATQTRLAAWLRAMTSNGYMPVSLIGLSGYARSGKDTAARVLTDGGWEQRAFADPLREFLLSVDPLVPTLDGKTTFRLSWLVGHLGWERAKDRFPEVRQLLQRTGTDAGRRVLGEDVWANRALQDLTDPVVLTDVRFTNEAEAIRERGGLVFRIDRPGVGPATAPDGTVHPSETQLDGFDFDAIIVNRGSTADLHRLVLDALVLHVAASPRR